MPNFRIEIMGPMGCGKTTLAQAFAALGVEVLHEKVEQNPYLAKFYADPPRFAFEKDLFFITDFMHQAKNSGQGSSPVAFDYSVWGTLAYVEAGPQAADTKKACHAVAQSALAEIGQPALLIYLDCPVEELAKRVAARARSIEDAVPVAYLSKLKAEMDKQVALAKTATAVMTIDVTTVDLRNPAVAKEWVQKALKKISAPSPKASPGLKP